MAGLTQQQFAEAIGIGRTYFNQLETIEDKEPDDELRDKIRDAIVMRVIVPARRLMSDAARISTSQNAIKSLEIRDNLSNRRVLLMDIEDANREPIIVPADWAIRIEEANAIAGKWLDVVLLDDYDLDELVGQ